MLRQEARSARGARTIQSLKQRRLLSVAFETNLGDAAALSEQGAVPETPMSILGPRH